MSGLSPELKRTLKNEKKTLGDRLELLRKERVAIERSLSAIASVLGTDNGASALVDSNGHKKRVVGPRKPGTTMPRGEGTRWIVTLLAKLKTSSTCNMVSTMANHHMPMMLRGANAPSNKQLQARVSGLLNQCSHTGYVKCTCVKGKVNEYQLTPAGWKLASKHEKWLNELMSKDKNK